MKSKILQTKIREYLDDGCPAGVMADCLIYAKQALEECEKDNADLRDKLWQHAERLEEIEISAQSLIERWESPAWKDDEEAAAVITKLRDALYPPVTEEPKAFLNKEPEREEKKSFHMVPEYLRMEDEGGASTKLEITQGRWKCTICGEWHNYIVANNHTIIGCGAASHSFGGNSVQCCGNCAPTGSDILHLANAQDEGSLEAAKRP